MKKVEIEIPDGKEIKWVGDTLTLVDETVANFKVGDKAILKKDTGFVRGSALMSIVAGTEVKISHITTSGLCEVRYENAIGSVYKCDLLPIESEQIDIKDQIKTFEDACYWCVSNGHQNIVDEHHAYIDKLGTLASKDVLAYLRLKIITTALNEGYKSQFDDFYPYLDGLNDEVMNSDYIDEDMILTMPVHLLFKEQKTAEYAGDTFRDIYEDFCSKKD